MSARLYDLGVENSEYQREKVKAFAWPVAAWKCYIPNSLSPDINILEKMALMLIFRGLAESQGDLRAILCDQIGMNPELVKNVIETCIEKYVDKRRSKLFLNDNAKKILESADSGISLTADPSDSMKSIYLFEDLISRRVIPCFNVAELPSDYWLAEEGKYIQIGRPLEKYPAHQPKTALINYAIRQWGRVRKQLQSEESEKTVRVNIAEAKPISLGEEDVDDEELDVAIPEEEAVVEKSSGNGSKTVDSTLNNEELARVVIYDDRPTKLWIKGYFVFDPDYPDEAEILSPFGSSYDQWFRTVIRHCLAEDENFRIELQFFKDDIIENLRDKVAFGNKLEISLFNEFPLICNDSARFSSLKKAIEDLSKSYFNLIHGENEAKHFAGDIRTALEVLFKCAVKENPVLLQADLILAKGAPSPASSNSNEIKRWRKSRYDIMLTRLADQIGMDRDILKSFKSPKIFDNLENDFRNRDNLDKSGNTKDLIAMIMVYAADNRSSKYWNFLKEFNGYLGTTYSLTGLGNGALHSANVNVTAQQAEQYYAQFEMIVRSVYSFFMEVV